MIGSRRTSSKKKRESRGVYSTALAVLLFAGFPLSLHAQPDDFIQLLANPYALLENPDVCGSMLGIGIGHLTPQARQALGQCRAEMVSADKAACMVLEAVELLSKGRENSAFKKLRLALSIYDDSADIWGAWLVEFLMGLASHDTGDAESYYQNALGRLDQLAASQQLIPGRSARLLGEIIEMPREQTAFLPLLTQLGMSSILVDLASTITHFITGVSAACQNRTVEAQQHFQEAESRLQTIMSLGSTMSSPGGGATPLPIFGQEPSPKPGLSVPREPRVPAAPTPVGDALHRNKTALLSPGLHPSAQARLWRERAALLAKADRVAEAKRAINTARVFAEISGVPLLEAEVLVNYGLDLYRLELFIEAEEIMNDGLSLLNQGVMHERKP